MAVEPTADNAGRALRRPSQYPRRRTSPPLPTDCIRGLAPVGRLPTIQPTSSPGFRPPKLKSRNDHFVMAITSRLQSLR